MRVSGWCSKRVMPANRERVGRGCFVRFSADRKIGGCLRSGGWELTMKVERGGGCGEEVGEEEEEDEEEEEVTFLTFSIGFLVPSDSSLLNVESTTAERVAGFCRLRHFCNAGTNFYSAFTPLPNILPSAPSTNAPVISSRLLHPHLTPHSH